MRKFIPSILFLISLVTCSIFYDYHEILLKRPESVHRWRQSDCASIALNYYQGGMHFFKPEVHNLTSDKGTSGKACTSEIPILYYTIALFYKIFGYHESIFRILNTLLFLTGLFFLFKLLFYLLKDTFWSVSLSILFFTSPVLVYYGNNFLSNSSALSFSLIGWYYFMRFYFESKRKLFYISILWFFLAAAFKVTALFSLCAIAGIYILETLNVKRFFNHRKLFNNPIKTLIAIISVFIVIGLWLIYAHYYNLKHDCTYFSTTIFPIWDLDKEAIREVLQRIKNRWLGEYFHISVLIFIALGFIFTLLYFKKNNQLLIYCILFIFMQVIVYILMQFWTFADHDYYTIDIFILPILITVCLFDVLNREYNKIISSWISKIIFSVFLIFNVYYAHLKINARYNGWMNDSYKDKDIYTITPYLRQIGITTNDTVISIPDASNATLYLMNQKGWTEYTDQRFNRGKKIYYNRDSTGIQASVNKGAKYLILGGIEELYKKPYLQSFCTNLKGHYNDVLIFKLKDKNENFKLSELQAEVKLLCSAELTTGDKEFFIGKPDSTLFENGNTQSNEFAHSGKYSSKLNADKPYGMTSKFTNLVNGESFCVSVWRKKTNNIKCGLIASAGSFYSSTSEIVESDSTGWEKIYTKFFINSVMVNQELKIYVYNPELKPVYFDDLEIIRNKSVF